MISTVKNLWSRARAHKQEARTLEPMDLALIKQLMVDSLDGSDDMSAERLRYTLARAQSATDLWMLRSDLYQHLSNRHSQSVAAQRINSLRHCFSGWVSASQINRV
mgnify:FL=1